MTRSVVLAYHRIAELDWDPLRMAVRPTVFATQIEMLLTDVQVVPVADLLRPASEPRVAITFDDGYRDVFDTAVPLLRRLGVPAAFFVVTAALRAGKGFWWDRLELLLRESRPVDGNLAVRTLATAFNAAGPRAQETIYKGVFRKLRRIPPAHIDRRLDQVIEAAGLASDVDTSQLLMGPAEVADLARDALFTVGAHTVAHPRLTALDHGSLVTEIAGSLQELSSLIEHPIDHFAYPFGDEASIDAVVRAEVEAAGCRLACANWDGWIDGGTDRFAMPRHVVVETTAEELCTSVQALLEEPDG